METHTLILDAPTIRSVAVVISEIVAAYLLFRLWFRFNQNDRWLHPFKSRPAPDRFLLWRGLIDKSRNDS